MRRLRGQHEDHFREIQGLERLTRENEMTMVNGIETAAVDANLFQARLRAGTAGAFADARAVAAHSRSAPSLTIQFLFRTLCIDSKVRRYGERFTGSTDPYRRARN